MATSGRDGTQSDRVAARIRIYGRVQGVWYRSWTVEQASARGLDGWVRNRADGSVEALAIGPAVAVEALIEACRGGPPAARVEHVDWRWEADLSADEFETMGFYQAPTV